MTRRLSLCLLALLTLLFADAPMAALAAGEGPAIELRLSDVAEPEYASSAVRILLLMTVLSVAPSILLMMTCFVRIVIALHFLRQALGTAQSPPNQVVIGLALFLTFFIMSPVIDQVHEQAWVPYQEGTLSAGEALEAGSGPLKDFMLRNTRQKDLHLFVKMARIERPESPAELPLKVVIPSFVLSELRAGFQIGFLLFLPFIVVDLVVASVLLSMGMMMLPPAMVSLPFKVLLFVLVDGWGLIAGSLVAGFR